jgi:serine/threonine-protein phosphatase CPPED1
MKIRNLALGYILLLVSCSVSKPPSKPYFFIQMADTQFGFFNENKSFEKETQNFEKAIAAANRLHPAFVIICGDLVNKVGDPAQIAEYKRIAAKLDRSIPLYSVAGNHDVGNIPTPATLKAYRENIGDDQYTFKKGDVFGIVLNSSLIKEPDSAKQEALKQESWIRSALEKARRSKSNSIMVFQHHSWFLTSPDEADQYFNMPIRQRNIYLPLFKQYGIKYLFAGHYHRNAGYYSPDLVMITTGPVGRPLGADSSGFRIVTVQKNEATAIYYSLDSIPEKK